MKSEPVLTPMQSLETSFRDALELPEDAIQWLKELWNVIQVLDDVADGDPIERKDSDAATWSCLAGMPSNPFYVQHQGWLLPAMSQMVLKWMASNVAEESGRADEKSYMWRAGYYDVVMTVTSLVHGPSSEMAFKALSLYGETAQDYMDEFKGA